VLLQMGEDFAIGAVKIDFMHESFLSMIPCARSKRNLLLSFPQSQGNFEDLFLD
jgi:hypothetical protein